tara:strand:- start:399 stop:1511 length:1113 start_codon:yes stop_codon:yes gene_type:complete
MSFFKKNILPELSDTIVDGNIEFYKSSTELMNIFESVSLDLVQYFIELDDTKSSDNVIKNLTDKYAELSNTNLKINNVEIPDSYKLYINEKFQNLLSLFKVAIKNKVNDLDKSIFSSYSDDIGMTLEINHNIGLTNSPIFDSFYNLEDSGAPVKLPPVMFNKVSTSLLKNFKRMSLKNDAILKTSLRNIAGYGTQNITETSHGKNLAYDNFNNKVKEQLNNIKTETIFNVFGENLGDLITFYKNLNIRQQEGNKSFFINYENSIEGVQNVLDIFNNNVYTTTTINVPFSAQFIPHDMYDPETGAAVFASTQELHLKYSELGYMHTKPIMIGGKPVFPDATQYTSPLPTTGSQGSSTSSYYERSIGSSSSY